MQWQSDSPSQWNGAYVFKEGNVNVLPKLPVAGII